MVGMNGNMTDLRLFKVVVVCEYVRPQIPVQVPSGETPRLIFPDAPRKNRKPTQDYPILKPVASKA